LEKAGVPAIAVITEPFGFKARAEVGALGLGNLPIQILPHPIGQISDDAMRALTDEGFDEVVFSLTTAADEVGRAYTDSVAPRSAYSR
jgi:hypothetical protein